VSSLENLKLDNLPIRNGEPMAISIFLQLHRLLATDDVIGGDTNNNVIINQSPDSALSLATHHRFTQSPIAKMECFLYGLWKLQPKVMVMTEQESDVNGRSLRDRVEKALHFYAALFDCLEAGGPNPIKRMMVERGMLGEQIKNIIACEGGDRKERYERLKEWIPRLELAGFRAAEIGLEGMSRGLVELQDYAGNYRIVRDDRSLFVCWNDIPLFSLSAWRYL
ncbi:hypothetical protein PIB30_027603, partial [Stylosanthes scabra]|nr:hypothetical protein [Stylosanthes scabra]